MRREVNIPGFGTVKVMEMLCPLLHRVLCFRSVCFCFSFLFLLFSLSALSPSTLLVFLLSCPSMFLFSPSQSLPLSFCSLSPPGYSLFSLFFFHVLSSSVLPVFFLPLLSLTLLLSPLSISSLSHYYFFLSFSPSVSCLFRSPSLLVLSVQNILWLL